DQTWFVTPSRRLAWPLQRPWPPAEVVVGHVEGHGIFEARRKCAEIFVQYPVSGQKLVTWSTSAMAIAARLRELHPELTAWRRDLHAHPQTAFEETYASEF